MIIFFFNQYPNGISAKAMSTTSNAAYLMRRFIFAILKFALSAFILIEFLFSSEITSHLNPVFALERVRSVHAGEVLHVMAELVPHGLT